MTTINSIFGRLVGWRPSQPHTFENPSISPAVCLFFWGNGFLKPFPESPYPHLHTVNRIYRQRASYFTCQQFCIFHI